MNDLPTPPAEQDHEGGQTLKSPVRLAGGGASLVGQRLGEYEVEAHLGAGGMGIVYRGASQFLKASDSFASSRLAMSLRPLAIRSSTTWAVFIGVG